MEGNRLISVNQNFGEKVPQNVMGLPALNFNEMAKQH